MRRRTGLCRKDQGRLEEWCFRLEDFRIIPRRKGMRGGLFGESDFFPLCFYVVKYLGYLVESLLAQKGFRWRNLLW